ncbi:MAG: sigma-70 family RNA polymerase sigma factor [Henriciella sp.]|nr:sigma-70 family RNA polymerase sigma factor [Henriciella sp.]
MSDSSELDDIARAAAGDATAQAALVNRHMPIIFRVSYRMLGDRAEAEDITQETFLRLWNALPDWQPKAKLSTWACTVALNLCRDRLRRKKPVLMEQLPDRVDPDLRPEQLLASNQTQARIHAGIAELPDRQKEALTLCALEGLSNIEAAEIMDVTVHALESLLARARRKLKIILQEEITS